VDSLRLDVSQQRGAAPGRELERVADVASRLETELARAIAGQRRVVRGDHLSTIARPSRTVVLNPMRSAWWLLLFSALLCVEWALRRGGGLK
jgi:hypothetical protein